MKPLVSFLILFLATHLSQAENKAGTWPIDRLQSEVPRFRVVDANGPIHSLIYEGEPVKGNPTEVFAFYASPKTLGETAEPESVPGIVLIHGGGGTAFSDWVWLWTERGYAAIAMDLSGRRPPEPKFDESGEKVTGHAHKREERVRLEKAGLDHTHEEKFFSIGGSIDDDWPYHAVANVMKAHSILRSFEEVDPERTAVTGISWGGYTTCLAASIDDRFKAAVPVYGCGFLYEGESVQKRSIDDLEDRRDLWIEAYDPSSHLAKSRVPMLWVNGTHDKHYPLDSYARSYQLPKGQRTIRIEPRMRHGHSPGWEPIEIGLFVDSHVNGGTSLPNIGPLQRDGATVSCSFESPVSITRATLQFTTGEGLRTERNWEMIEAKIKGSSISATPLPPQANTWFFTVEDERGALI
ncbi:MAG: prolyl oligopeptidase family serine peptidase, partial [Verrucomicrobiota bacterium]